MILMVFLGVSALVGGLCALAIYRQNRIQYSHNANGQFLKASYNQLQREMTAGIWPAKEAQKYEQDLLKQILKLSETPRPFTQLNKWQRIMLAVALFLLFVIGGGWVYLTNGRPEMAPITQIEWGDYYFNQSVSALHAGSNEISLNNLEKLRAMEGDSADIILLLLENKMALNQFDSARQIIKENIHNNKQDFSFQITLLRHLLRLGVTKAEIKPMVEHILTIIPTGPGSEDIKQKLEEIIKK